MNATTATKDTSKAGKGKGAKASPKAKPAKVLVSVPHSYEGHEHYDNFAAGMRDAMRAAHEEGVTCVDCKYVVTPDIGMADGEGDHCGCAVMGPLNTVRSPVFVAKAPIVIDTTAKVSDSTAGDASAAITAPRKVKYDAAQVASTGVCGQSVITTKLGAEKVKCQAFVERELSDRVHAFACVAHNGNRTPALVAIIEAGLAALGVTDDEDEVAALIEEHGRKAVSTPTVRTPKASKAPLATF